jgi:hypothetical protein
MVGEPCGLLLLSLLHIISISSIRTTDGSFYFTVWNSFFIFYSASAEIKLPAFTEYALNFNVFLIYDKIQFARSVFPTPTEPVSK